MNSGLKGTQGEKEKTNYFFSTLERGKISQRDLLEEHIKLPIFFLFLALLKI
jgi:hypothetical protein